MKYDIYRENAIAGEKTFIEEFVGKQDNLKSRLNELNSGITSIEGNKIYTHFDAYHHGTSRSIGRQ
jgi:hypothetical protein